MSVKQSNRSHGIILLILCGLGVGPVRQSVGQGLEDPVAQSAIYLLKQSMVLDRQGRHNILLRALRHLEDPELRPLFAELMSSDSRALKIHGLLGVAECDVQHKIDLKGLAEMQDSAVQAELLGAALDSELIDLDQSKQLIGWQGLELDAKIVIATRLIEKGQFKDIAMLKKGMELENQFTRAVAALLLWQLGDSSGKAYLDLLNESDEPLRDSIRAGLLQTAYRFKMDKLADWAGGIAAEPKVNSKLGLLAIRTAMRLGHKPSLALWTKQYKSTTDLADRTRLAFSLLNLAPWLDASMFDPMANDSEAFLKLVGKAGAAASSKTNVLASVVKLIEQNHPITDRWALLYAKDYAPDKDGRDILLALIMAYDTGTARNKSNRLDNAMNAAQFLFERDEAMATKLLKPMLSSQKTDDVLRQGLLISLIRTKEGKPAEIVKDLAPFPKQNANNLKLLLMAKNGTELTSGQMKDLGLLVRGGGGMPEALRLQAAWIYLKRTKQAQQALAKVLEG